MIERGDGERDAEGSEAPTAGWRPDPFGRHSHRWWDGSSWTASVTSGGGVQLDPAPVQTIEPPSPGLPGIGIALVGYVGGVALSLLAVLVPRWLGASVSRATELAVSSGALWVGLLAAAAVVSVRRGTGSLVRDYGLRFRWADLGYGLAGAVVARIVAGLAIAPLPLFDPDLGEGNDRSVFEEATTDGWTWLVIALVVCVGAPLVEEVFFRGLLQNRLVERWGLVLGVLAASLLFGAAHLVAWSGPITAIHAWAVAGAGLVLGATYHYARRLGAAVVAHSLFNAVALAAVWATRT